MPAMKQYYVTSEIAPSSAPGGVTYFVNPFTVDGDEVRRYGATGLLSEVEDLKGRTFEQFFDETRPIRENQLFPNHVRNIFEAPIPFGSYHPRIRRPIAWNSSSGLPEDAASRSHLDIQLELFTEELRRIFRYIDPEPEHLSVFSHEIRNLLILSATEVEAQWKGILTANSYEFNLNSQGDPRVNTSDYVKLLQCLRLTDYKVLVPRAPKLTQRCPFEDWSPAQPTQSLDWYSAYNAVKHDREANFHKANLGFALDSVIACDILRSAQYECNSMFEHVSTPIWEAKDYYISPPKDEASGRFDWSVHAYEFT